MYMFYVYVDQVQAAENQTLHSRSHNSKRHVQWGEWKYAAWIPLRRTCLGVDRGQYLRRVTR